MTGRGARRLPKKHTFTVLDFGQNVARLGRWDAAVDWHSIFTDPEAWYARIGYGKGTGDSAPDVATRSRFGNSLKVGYDILHAVEEAEQTGHRHAEAIASSIRQHALICMENADTASAALQLAAGLTKDIRKRVKAYASTLERPSKSYVQWLEEDYRKRLSTLLRRSYRIRNRKRDASSPIAS